MVNKIMFIDSEILVGKMVVKRLAGSGYDVIELQTRGEDALQILQEEMPDLIIMDVILSGILNGLETAKIITCRYKIPIIFFTTYHEKSIIQRVQKLKPAAILDKFVPFEEIRAVIESIK